MIRIIKSSEPPSVLKDNCSEWTKNLDDAVNKYGAYSKIPKAEKEKLLKYYRLKEIQDELAKASYRKCAFCECIPSEGGNLEVEHFAPKSLYHKLTFEWDNLLPICRKCNDSKSNHDTIKEPILNPSIDDTEKYIDFNLINMVAKGDTEYYEKASLTIDVCSLNGTRLLKARADLLVRLSEYQQKLSQCLKEIEQASTERIKSNKIRKLKESIETIEELGDKSEKYSLFSKRFLEKSQEYFEAKEILNNINNDN